MQSSHVIRLTTNAIQQMLLPNTFLKTVFLKDMATKQAKLAFSLGPPDNYLYVQNLHVRTIEKDRCYTQPETSKLKQVCWRLINLQSLS